MIGGAQMMYQHSSPQIVQGPAVAGIAAGAGVSGAGLAAAGAWSGHRFYQPSATPALNAGYTKSLAPPALPSREAAGPLRASSVLSGGMRPETVVPSYAPVAHRRNDRAGQGPPLGSGAGLSIGEARGMSLCRGEIGGAEKSGMASSNSQGAIAVTAGTGPSASMGSASLSQGLGGDRSSVGANGVAANNAGGGNVWPHSPEPRMRAAFPGAAANPPRPPSSAPVREGGASLGGIFAGDKPSWSSVGNGQMEAHSSARCRSGANGGSGNYAIAHSDVSGEASGAAKVVRQISMPSSRHELPGAQAAPRQSQGVGGTPSVQTATLPGPSRHLSPPVFPQEMPPSSGTAGAEPMAGNGMPTGRPPPQVVSYSARAGAQGRPGQPYTYHGMASEAPSSGRSPARVRPTVQVVTGNRSPARTRPMQATPLWCDGQAFPLGTATPYQATGPGPLLVPLQADPSAQEASLSDGGGLLTGIYPGSASYPPPAPQGNTSVAAVVGPEREATLQDASGQNNSWQDADRDRTGNDDDMDFHGPLVQNGDGAALMQAQIQAARRDFAVWDDEEAPEPVAAGELTEQERIGYHDLQFVEHLGSGEFGQVFRGFYAGQEVAIKQLYWDNTVAPEVIIQDLTREIESFRHLRHKRLVSFIGACLEVPNLCLVTEYLPGGSLHHLLHVRKLRLPLLHCSNMCLQLADGVLYLHSQNPVVVHRDLKSLNVVLDMNLNLKLCDFGLTESMDRTHITKKNNGGSPRYMAPELFDNKSKITEKVDIWSMGCIFTEIFGGPLPYEGINTLADLTREMLVHRRMPQIPAGLPEPIQNVIRSCYNFDARLRPSAKQVYDELKDVKKRLRTQGII